MKLVEENRILRDLLANHDDLVARNVKLEKIHGELKQKLRDFWVAHIEPLDHQLENPIIFTMTFEKREKDEIERLLK